MSLLIKPPQFHGEWNLGLTRAPPVWRRARAILPLWDAGRVSVSQDLVNPGNPFNRVDGGGGSDLLAVDTLGGPGIQVDNSFYDFTTLQRSVSLGAVTTGLTCLIRFTDIGTANGSSFVVASGGGNGFRIDGSNKADIWTSGYQRLTANSAVPTPSPFVDVVWTQQNYGPLAIYYNGVLDNSGTDTGYGHVGEVVHIGGLDGQGGRKNAKIIFFATWPEILNADEIRSLSTPDPWAPLRMDVSRIVPLVGGAAASVNATFAVTPSAFTASSGVSIEIEASSTASIPAFGLTAAAGSELTAASDTTIANFDLSSGVGVVITDELTTTIEDFVLVSSGSLEIGAETDAAIDEFTLVSATALSLDAEFNTEVPAFTLTSATGLSIDADVNTTLPNFTLVSAFAVPLTADSALTLDDFTLTSEVIYSDALSVISANTINAFTLSAAGDLHTHLESSNTIEGFTLSAGTDLQIDAVLDALLDGFSVEIDSGLEAASADLIATLDDFSLLGETELFLDATVTPTLPNFVSTGAASLTLDVESTATPGDFTLQSTSDLAIEAESSPAFDSFGLTFITEYNPAPIAYQRNNASGTPDYFPALTGNIMDENRG